MLHNSFSHINTQTTIGFPVVPRRHAERRRYQPPAAVVAMSAPSLAVNNKIRTGGGKGMNWFYELEQEVREYELDQFGVVNNAIYSNYVEYGTYKLLEKIGFDNDIRLAVSEVSIKYIAPLKACANPYFTRDGVWKRKDKYVLKLRLYDYSTTRFYFEDQIVKLPTHELMVRGTATLVLLDEKLRPTRLTPSMLSKFNQFLLSHTN